MIHGRDLRRVAVNWGLAACGVLVVVDLILLCDAIMHLQWMVPL